MHKVEMIRHTQANRIFPAAFGSDRQGLEVAQRSQVKSGLPQGVVTAYLFPSGRGIQPFCGAALG
jgi:hypothetical protein